MFGDEAFDSGDTVFGEGPEAMRPVAAEFFFKRALVLAMAGAELTAVAT